MESWHQVYEVIVGMVDIDFILKNVFPKVMDMSGLKNPYAKRKRGNRLITSLA